MSDLSEFYEQVPAALLWILTRLPGARVVRITKGTGETHVVLPGHHQTVGGEGLLVHESHGRVRDVVGDVTCGRCLDALPTLVEPAR